MVGKLSPEMITTYDDGYAHVHRSLVQLDDTSVYLRLDRSDVHLKGKKTRRTTKNNNKNNNSNNNESSSNNNYHHNHNHNHNKNKSNNNITKNITNNNTTITNNNTTITNCNNDGETKTTASPPYFPLNLLTLSRALVA